MRSFSRDGKHYATAMPTEQSQEMLRFSSGAAARRDESMARRLKVARRQLDSRGEEAPINGKFFKRSAAKAP
jgi:hypothetical protein